MSTSDAAVRDVGGKTTAPATRTTREQQDEAFEEDDNHQTGQHSQQTHTGLISGADRSREEEKFPARGSLKVQTWRAIGTRFTSSLSFRFSRKPGSAELKPKKKPDPCPHSLTRPLRRESGKSQSQVNGRTSPPDTSVEAASDLPSSGKALATGPICNELETTPTSGLTSSFSNGELQPYECNGLHTVPHGSQPRRTGFGSVDSEEDIKDFTRLENQNHLLALSDPMLSSTMVSVLAPNWNSRLRRTKRGVAIGDLGVQGNSQDVTYGPNTKVNSPHEQFLETQSQHFGESGLRDVSQAQLRASFLGTGRNITGWSTMSGPPSLNLDYESQREAIQSVSFDVNPDGHGWMPQSSHQGELSHPSSKPTTSGHLFSLRGLNSSWRSSLSETNPLSVTSSTNDRAAQFFRPHLSPTLLNNNEPERLTSLPYSSSISYTTTETDPIHSPSSPNHREGGLSKTPLFPASQKNKVSPLSQTTTTTTTTRTQTTPSCPKQTFLTGGLLERHQNYKDPEKRRTDHMSAESSLSQPRLSSYDRHAYLKCQSLPRRTTLTSTSWWKQVTQEGTAPLSLNDTTNIRNKNETSTPLVNNSDLASRSPIDNKGFSSQIPSNRDNNNTVESAYKGNLNTVMNSQGGAHILRRRNAEDTPDRHSDKLFKRGFNLNHREPQKPHSLPSDSLGSKFSSDAGQTTLSHPKDLSMPDVSDSAFKTNINELQLTLLNPKSPNISTESTNHYTTKTNNTPTTPHSFRDSYTFYPLSLDQDAKSQHKCNSEKNDLTANTKHSPALFIPPSTSSPNSTNVELSKTTSCTDQAEKHRDKSDTFTKQSLPQDATKALNSQALSLKAVSGPKTSSSSNTQSHSSHTSIPSVSHTGSVPNRLSTKFTKTATATPIGFERSYTSIPKSLHPKATSILVPTSHITPPPKTNYSTVSTASTSPTTSATSLCSHPAPTTPTISSLLTPPITPQTPTSPKSPPRTPALTYSATSVTTSSLLTPPATPTLNCPVETSLRQLERTFSGSLDLTPKRQHSQVEGRRVGRVTWEDSVDLQCSEATMVQKSEPPQTPTSPLSPPRSPRSLGSPSTFSILRLGSSTGTSPLCPPSPKTSTIHAWRGGKHPGGLSSDSAAQVSRERGRTHTSASRFNFDHGEGDSISPRHERKLSEEASPDRCHSAAPLSLPPDFASGYQRHYSSTPYSTLKSTQSTQGEAEDIAPMSTLFQQTSLPSKSIYTVPLSSRLDHITSYKYKSPLSPINSAQPLSPHFQKTTGLQGSSKVIVSETDNNYHCKHSGQDGHKGQMSVVLNRVDISSQPPLLQTDEALGSLSTCVNVVETLVYNISKGDSTSASAGTPKPLMQHTTNTHVPVETTFSRQPFITQSKKAIDHPQCQSNQSSNASSSKENQCPPTAHTDEGWSNGRMKESGISKSRLFSLVSKNEIPPPQSPKRGLFTLKKTNSSLHANKESLYKARPEPESVNKSANKVDKVLSKLRQTFSSRRSDDDLFSSWRWKRPPQTPSVSGSSSDSVVTVESNKTMEEEEEERGEVGRDSHTGIQERESENRYTLTPPLAVGNRMVGDQFSIWPDKTTIDGDQNKHSTKHFAKDQDSESKIQAHWTSCRPTRHQFDFYKDDRADYKPTNTSPSHRDLSPARQQSWSPNHSVNQCSKSTSSPRSPFSPFSSLSPVSPFPTAVEDSVFYSPKPQRRGGDTYSCEQGEGISLVDSTRSRQSTAPSSGGHCPAQEASYSSCADIKYGIEARRSFSVSSVLSSRPSGPGRISTGSRFMSVSDLSDPAMNSGGYSSSSSGMSLDQWAVRDDQTPKYDYRIAGGNRLTSDPGKMRSRSLPRSLTLWSSEVTAPPAVTTTTTKRGRLWSPNLDTYHFVRDTEAPPTPPPSPPSPTSRRISKPPSVSSPSSPSLPGASQDGHSPRGNLPSKGYVCSLSAFEESSDSSSDTTTDDEYYLETVDDDKETEL